METANEIFEKLYQAILSDAEANNNQPIKTYKQVFGIPEKMEPNTFFFPKAASYIKKLDNSSKEIFRNTIDSLKDEYSESVKHFKQRQKYIYIQEKTYTIRYRFRTDYFKPCLEIYECYLQPDTKIEKADPSDLLAFQNNVKMDKTSGDFQNAPLDELTYEKIFNSSPDVTIHICFSVCSSYFIQSIQDTALLDLYQGAITRIAKAVVDHNSSIDDGLQKCIFQYSGIIFSFIYQFVIKKEVLYMEIMECSINGLVKE